MDIILNNGAVTDRKESRDTGRNVFNCGYTHTLIFTQFNFYKKRQTVDFKVHFRCMKVHDLKKEWYDMKDEEKVIYELMVIYAQDCGTFLHHYLVTILKATHGSITYHKLSTKMYRILGPV